MPLPLSALRAFEAAARTGSFRAAAADLGLMPSAVSHAVRGLEQSLGGALFLHEGRSIRLTPDGETLMRHVERVRRAAARHRRRSGAGPHLLRLQSATIFAANWLAPRLRRMLQDCAGLEVRISAGVDYTRFLADEFDADVVYGLPSPAFCGSGPAQRGVVVLPLGTEVVTPLRSPALAAEIRSPRDLLRHTLIESDNKRLRWPFFFVPNALLLVVSYVPALTVRF